MTAVVLVIDDHALVASSLVMALRQRGLAASAVAPADAIARIDEPAPPGGLVLLDLDLGPGLDGAALIPRLRRGGWRVLLVTGSIDEVRIATAITAGAVGRVDKSALFDDLVAAALRVAQGRPLIDDTERARLREVAETAHEEGALEQDRWRRLTPRERQIAELMAEGRRPATIAEDFVVSVATVRTQVRSILGKLEVGSQLEVAALARRLRRRR